MKVLIFLISIISLIVTVIGKVSPVPDKHLQVEERNELFSVIWTGKNIIAGVNSNITTSVWQNWMVQEIWFFNSTENYFGFENDTIVMDNGIKIENAMSWNFANDSSMVTFFGVESDGYFADSFTGRVVTDSHGKPSFEMVPQYTTVFDWPSGANWATRQKVTQNNNIFTLSSCTWVYLSNLPVLTTYEIAPYIPFTFTNDDVSDFYVLPDESYIYMVREYGLLKWSLTDLNDFTWTVPSQPPMTEYPLINIFVPGGVDDNIVILMSYYDEWSSDDEEEHFYNFAMQTYDTNTDTIISTTTTNLVVEVLHSLTYSDNYIFMITSNATYEHTSENYTLTLTQISYDSLGTTEVVQSQNFNYPGILVADNNFIYLWNFTDVLRFPFL